MNTPTKDELERQKLALEIRELQRRWWQRPVYLSILLPIALAALTVLAGILSGYFNRERRQLTRDIETLKSEKAALGDRTAELLAANGKAQQELAKTRQKLATLPFEYIKRAAKRDRERASREWEANTRPSSPTPTPTPGSN